MNKLTNSQMVSLNGGDICLAGSGFLAGFSLGAAGMFAAGVATVATGGAATVIIAAASAALAVYCAKH